MIALLVALGVGALAVLQPWETDTLAPQLSVAPGLGVELGDAAVVSRDRQLAVEPARPAVGATPKFVAGDVAVDRGEPQPRLGIAAARVVVASPGPDIPSQGSPQQPPQPELTPVSQPAPAPVAASPPPVEPVAAPPTRAAGGGTSGPIGAGGGGEEGGGTEGLLQVCAGDDYTLPLLPVEAVEGGEVPPVVSHDLIVYFGSSGEGTGFHLVLFDGRPVEFGEDAIPTEPGESCAQIDFGSLLDEPVEAGTEIHVEAVTLGEAMEPVVP